MKWLCALTLLGACGGHGSPPADAGGVSLVLDIPNGALEPKGFTTVEIVLHGPREDMTRTANVAVDNTFALGPIDPTDAVSIEATLRNDSGAAVGYGRTAIAAAFAAGAQIVIPVRRPIAYIAGTVSRDISTGQTPDVRWTESPATFSDLSIGASLDGKTQVGSQAVLMIAAGPSLYMVTQAIGNTTGVLTGPATVVPVSVVDHQIGAALTGQMTGAVIDGAGTDDGAALVIGTSTQLFAVDTTTGMARALTDGNFARVAVVTTPAGEVAAVAIKNRGATTGPCSTTAELWWVPLSGSAPQKVATGGFSDIATDRGRAYYVDACKGELGELTATTTAAMLAVGSPGTQRPTALAVSNGQAYIGLETQPTAQSLATTSLQVATLPMTQAMPMPMPLPTTDVTRTLWTEAAEQVLDVVSLPEVRRQLEASSVVFNHLEIGAGGDYIALTTSAHFHGAELVQVGFPEMTIDTEELRVFDAATGGIVQRYRSWCAGVLRIDPLNDIRGWECASTAGQTEAAGDMFEHHLNSMTFQFGKK
jgi:hypothetical protein